MADENMRHFTLFGAMHAGRRSRPVCAPSFSEETFCCGERERAAPRGLAEFRKVYERSERWQESTFLYESGTSFLIERKCALASRSVFGFIFPVSDDQFFCMRTLYHASSGLSPRSDVIVHCPVIGLDIQSRFGCFEHSPCPRLFPSAQFRMAQWSPSQSLREA